MNRPIPYLIPTSNYLLNKDTSAIQNKQSPYRKSSPNSNRKYVKPVATQTSKSSNLNRENKENIINKVGFEQTQMIKSSIHPHKSQLNSKSQITFPFLEQIDSNIKPSLEDIIISSAHNSILQQLQYPKELNSDECPELLQPKDNIDFQQKNNNVSQDQSSIFQDEHTNKKSKMSSIQVQFIPIINILESLGILPIILLIIFIITEQINLNLSENKRNQSSYMNDEFREILPKTEMYRMQVEIILQTMKYELLQFNRISVENYKIELIKFYQFNDPETFWIQLIAAISEDTSIITFDDPQTGQKTWMLQQENEI